MIGLNKERIDVLDKVLGKPVFAGDRSTEGSLFAVVYRSPRPHAWIRRVDLSKIQAQPGVVKVITAADIPGQNRFGAIKKDQQCLAENRKSDMSGNLFF